MDTIPMRGTIVIGEGERDEAPMLYIGEQVGAEFPDGTEVPEVDIAVDPLEGTNLCATGAPGSITVLAASERGGLLQRARLLHGKDRGWPVLQGSGRSGRARRAKISRTLPGASTATWTIWWSWCSIVPATKN